MWMVWVVTLHQVGWLVTGGGWRLARRGGGLCCTIDLSSISNVHSINIAATTHPSAKTRAKQSQIELVNAICVNFFQFSSSFPLPSSCVHSVLTVSVGENIQKSINIGSVGEDHLTHITHWLGPGGQGGGTGQLQLSMASYYHLSLPPVQCCHPPHNTQ